VQEKLGTQTTYNKPRTEIRSATRVYDTLQLTFSTENSTQNTMRQLTKAVSCTLHSNVINK